ncbi:CobW family GTP-binding protein [Marinobacter shengliensis]|uniref:CobW family GTP-binding protein n=1 Tax=Marinobacter shengliensis TaxID=1389223 RepID=UPI00257264DA|nr:GTP-binding protein [Marinobacter shengliensis]BEH13791.1 GTP-binding protein [Marinobacter shengliensis]
MSDPVRPVPTNLILGFLGVGKTTAILDLLRQKPEGEVWAVLVNEFGEVGIDGAILETEGAVVREIPGGCMCCVAGLPMQIGLNQLIARAKPDRLLIEPTGLGHPSQILDTLTGEYYQDVLKLGPVITLVDPRKLEDPRVQDNVQFRDQVAAADILVANKTDLCTDNQVHAFDQWAVRLAPEGRPVYHTNHGHLSVGWLDGTAALPEVSEPHAHHHHHGKEADTPPPPSIHENPWQWVTNRGQGHNSIGWRIHPELMLEENVILAMAMDDRLLRFKAVIHTRDGWRVVNVVDGAVTILPGEPSELSRVELISAEALDASEMDQLLRAAAGLTDQD